MNNEKLFMYGVGTAVVYIGDNWYYRGNTLSTSGVTLTGNKLEIRGGTGNGLQFVGNNTSSLAVEITDVQFNMALIALKVGTDPTIGGDIFTTAKATIANNIGTLPAGAAAPISASGGLKAYVHAEVDGTYLNMPMIDATTFTATGVPNGDLCVTYLYNEKNATQIVIPSNPIPAVGNLYITTPVYSSAVGTGARGSVTVNVPLYKVDADLALEMTADGASNMKISGMALVREGVDNNCTGLGMYATITQYLKDTKPIDKAIGLSIIDGDFKLAVGATKTLKVYGIGSGDTNLGELPNASLTFTSGTAGTATIAETGVVTGVAAGTSLITVKITDKPDIDISCTVTVPA